MATSNSKNLGEEKNTQRSSSKTELVDLFSSYKAEWLKEKVFDLFSEPAYFPQLKTSNPCFLIGGRGTGKTTALKCLSYEGQFALLGGNSLQVQDWDFYGLYYRVNTNRVTAFSGPELNKKNWSRFFAHWTNLEFCRLVLEFLDWHTGQLSHLPLLSEEQLQPFAESIHISNPRTPTDALQMLNRNLRQFEAFVNNIGDDSKNYPSLSMQGAPIDAIFEALQTLPHFKSKHFFFLIDEYENYSDDQQMVLNTLIKHCGNGYSFKIGVRELGLRQHSTLNPNEQLIHPADYHRIDIAEELQSRFSDFATTVCNSRLAEANRDQELIINDIQDLFPELPLEKEAELLGVGEQVSQISNDVLESSVSEDVKHWWKNLSALEQFSLVCRSDAKKEELSSFLSESYAKQDAWKRHYNNYKYVYIFKIRKGKSGVRKYYVGWRVFSLLAAGNIRYLLELIHASLVEHSRNGKTLNDAVEYSVQTRSAQNTGQKNLRELEGLSIYGAQLTRLLLGLGRICQILAEDASGHTPEVTQFYISSNSEENTNAIDEKVDALLESAVMHLALLRYPGSKLQEPSDTRQYDYAIHPIFAPFFVFSHRRKRKIPLTPSEILGLVNNPPSTIRAILEKQNRKETEALPAQLEELPEQLRLFGEFYGVSR